MKTMGFNGQKNTPHADATSRTIKNASSLVQNECQNTQCTRARVGGTNDVSKVSANKDNCTALIFWLLVK